MIVRNIPEPSKQGKSEQIEVDTAKISDLFQNEFGIERAQIKKLVRLGKRAQDRVRLILITVDFDHS